MVEKADGVLAAREIDRRLASNRRVDLGHQRGRSLHELDAAQEAAGDEATEGADGAAAEGDEPAVALALGGEHLVP